MGDSAVVSACPTDRVRLHITPLHPGLLDRYIPSSLKPQVSNISFHAIETFPERGFGFIELPAVEAQKLKKKLHGMTLQGSKVRIQDAKPEKKRKGVQIEDEEPKRTSKKARKEKAPREKGVLPGHELEEGRHVKRGWVDDAAARKTNKKLPKGEKESLKGKKMRFKTALPANAAQVDVPKIDEKQGKRDKKEKKSRGEKKAAVVKEFSNTVRLPATAAKRTNVGARYEDGKGWVDEDGNVVEAERPSNRRQHMAELNAATTPAAVAANLSEQTPDEKSESESESEPEPSSDDESGDSAMAEVDLDTGDVAGNEAAPSKSIDHVVEPESASDAAVPSDAAPAMEKEVHPLEALFKRPVSKVEDTTKPKKLTPIDTSFSFFATDGADQEDDNNLAVNDTLYPPQTPHTTQDLEWRSIRSAAPTPDTAAIGKRFTFGEDESAEEENDSDKNDDQDESESDSADGGETPKAERAAPSAAAGAGEKEETEFRKWFYENRGDLNRSWKKRRREEKKVTRQRENRRLSRKLA